MFNPIKNMKRKLTALFVLALVIVSIAAPVLASTYVANANTGKFHYSGCRYVSRMNESNKVYYNDRDDVINAGYVPCKVCRP
ncbi:Ada metal-binding domain-containing protein [Anaerosinus massiliensis]|uniref:Ada metal-binding domain-containing protein n=1 Tax=Massilibacillus massiliensis TaxID=1806837 RepID=UPI0018FEF820|nr:Ada metal-binding domain-containing protein [Massilibacillus massiliensis]